jgi:cytochrome c553
MRSLKARRTGAKTTSWRGRGSWTAVAILTVALTGAARAQDEGASRSGVQAKLGYCKDCHGPSAQGYRGYYPIPRLAGQQT